MSELHDACRSLPSDALFEEPDDALFEGPDSDLYHLFAPFCRCTQVRRCIEGLLGAVKESRRNVLAYQARHSS